MKVRSTRNWGTKKNMNVNCVNIEREKESLKITNVNLLVRFNKAREIFPSNPSIKHFTNNSSYHCKYRKIEF